MALGEITSAWLSRGSASTVNVDKNIAILIAEPTVGQFDPC